MPQATLHDGSTIEIEVHGAGPAVVLPVNPRPVEGPQAEEMRRWGADPALGRSLIDGLSDAFRMVVFDYEGQVLGTPKPRTLTPANAAADVLAVADAAGAERFAYYGYSWLAVIGLQLAIRTARLSALVMGGWPPIDAPYRDMLRVTEASAALSAAQATGNAGEPDAADKDDEWSSTGLSEDQAQQFVTLYLGLQDFDDRATQSQIRCPRLCFVGSADEMAYSERWGGVQIELAGPIVRGRSVLEELGWDVEVLDGLDHIQAMQAARVLPIVRPWLASALSGEPDAWPGHGPRR
jgi:pimeloyl-ACP methyl ester carboxylesterase